MSELVNDVEMQCLKKHDLVVVNAIIHYHMKRKIYSEHKLETW